ncbi:MAG: FkbM family methyltransferase [Synergistaceae bacterium]|nr:FkbM family methyltransferase [Synergistaceae bacterium]
MSIITTLTKKIIGRSPLLHNLVYTQYIQGNYFKAAALMLWMLPMKNLVKPDDFVKHFDIITTREYYEELQKLLHIAKVDGFEVVRTGKKHDGGYILLDDFHDGGIAYSFGISSDVSWDKDMVSRGYDIFMYDHTINGLPEENSHFHWSRFGISDGVTQDNRLKTLDELIHANHHENTRNMILKMDVEGAEWGFLSQVSSETLSQFGQMTFEFHGIPGHTNPELVLEVFRKLNRTHQLVHIHANNNGHYISFGHKKFCDLFEFTYVLRSKYSFIDDYDVNLPLSIDDVNVPSLPEIILGRWNEYAQFGEKVTVHVKAL